ncbi:MAG: hypothetical protein J6J42_04040 [Lachnospiraceae bacterium]|nr:hypothetical protein [Lachnospiraceae bacterium]
MDEADRVISYEEFKERLFKELKNYFSDTELKKPNYELKVREEKDAYETMEEMLYLSDVRTPEKEMPAYSLAVAYETCCRSGNVEQVMELLANVMETQYPQEEIHLQSEEERILCSVDELPGEPEEGVRNVYLITAVDEAGIVHTLVQNDETLSAIAEKEQSNLQIIPVDEGAALAVPVTYGMELEENRGIMEELSSLQRKEMTEECQVYDRNRNLLISDMEEIKNLLEKGKVKKKSMFTK